MKMIMLNTEIPTEYFQFRINLSYSSHLKLDKVRNDGIHVLKRLYE